MPDASRHLADYLTLSDEIRSLDDAPPNSVREAFRDLLRMMNELDIPYAMFGAFAVAAYVSERRSTLDIDVVARPEHLSLVRARCGEFGFEEIARDPEAIFRSFRHRNGVRVDCIFDDRAAFVDFTHAHSVDVPAVGRVVVADIVDIALAKLRTQPANWPRDPKKRAQDYSDLVAMLEENPALAEALYERITPSSALGESRDHRNLREILRRACGEAGTPFPDASLLSGWRRRHWLAALCGLLVVAAVITWWTMA